MAEGESVAKHGGKVVDFFKQSTAGLPNWAWLLVIGAGIAAAIVVPKLFNQGGSTNTGTGTGTTTDTGTSGIGLAVDPTTGLPYAVEGLVPSGAQAGNTISSPPTVPVSPTTTTTQSTPTPVQPSQAISTPVAARPTVQPSAQYVTVSQWPQPLSTLSGIAQANGLSLSRVESLNPQLGPSNGRNFDLIYPGEKVRIA